MGELSNSVADLFSNMRNGNIQFQLLLDNGELVKLAYNGFKTVVNDKGNTVVIVTVAFDN